MTSGTIHFENLKDVEEKLSKAISMVLELNKLLSEIGEDCTGVYCELLEKEEVAE